MVDKSKVGLTDEPTEMPIERGKIREFAIACMTRNPEYVETQDAGRRADVPDHGELLDERVRRRRSRRSGSTCAACCTAARSTSSTGRRRAPATELTMQTRVDKIYEKEGKRGGTMTFVETVTEFRDPDGKLVAEARSTAIETGQAPTEGS